MPTLEGKGEPSEDPTQNHRTDARYAPECGRSEQPPANLTFRFLDSLLELARVSLMRGVQGLLLAAARFTLPAHVWWDSTENPVETERKFCQLYFSYGVEAYCSEKFGRSLPVNPF
jgi:hypothetical protein